MPAAGATSTADAPAAKYLDYLGTRHQVADHTQIIWAAPSALSPEDRLLAARNERQKLLHGALETLILRTLAQGPMHGYAIARWIEERSRDAIAVEEGSLYPALYRLERKGLLEAEWGVTELERRAKFYRLTDEGEARMEAATAEWDRFSAAVAAVLRHG